ncbi:MAG: lysophospholipid acyltransferase family protein [Polyangiales bacterium]
MQRLGGTAIGRKLRDLPLDYFSATLEDANRIPREGGALLVGNHAMMGLDGFVLGALVNKHTGRYVRFLAERNLWKLPLVRDFLDAVGALPGEPERATELLRNGELLGVYPGGIDDSWKLTKTQRYRLQWGNRAGFARVAMRAGVPIVPIAALGIDEMYDVVAKESVVGRMLLGSSRYDLPLAIGRWGLPIPKPIPQRYFVLPPVDTAGDPDDASAVERVRGATFASIDSVLRTARNE